MKARILAIIAFTFLGLVGLHAQVITGFGSSDLNPVNTSTDFFAPWSAANASQSATSLTITGQPASGGGELFSTLSTAVTLGDSNPLEVSLLLTGAVTVATPANNFSITLFDTSGDFNSLTFTYSWGSWSTIGVTQTVASTLPTESGDFNGTVGSYAIQVGGGPSDTISFRFDNLSAVPEPSTYAMLIAGLGALYFFGRRRKVARVRA